MHHTLFDGYAIAIRRPNATQPFPSCPDWHHAARPRTRCGVIGDITHENGAEMGITSPNPARSQTQNFGTDFALRPLRLFAALATVSRPAVEQRPASEIRPIEPSLVTDASRPALVPKA